MAITITQLARIAGVSAGAVSLVLNNKDKGQVSAARRKRILALAKRHGYRANQAARALVQRKAQRVALCHDASLSAYDSFQIYALFNLLTRFTDGLQAMGYAIELLNIRTAASRKGGYDDVLRKAVDGYMFLMMSRGRVEPFMRLLQREGKPAVASGTSLEHDLTWTDIDREEAFSRAVRDLAAEGHTRIALLECGAAALAEVKRRAFLRAMREHVGVDARPWVFRTRKRHFLDVHRTAGQALAAVRGVTALVLTSTYNSEAVVRAVQDKGMKPGADCRVIGWGYSVAARRTRPYVSHFSLRIPEEAAFGMRALADAMDHPDRYEARHKLFRSRFIKEDT